jgi:hypothetical protein
MLITGAEKYFLRRKLRCCRQQRAVEKKSLESVLLRAESRDKTLQSRVRTRQDIGANGKLETQAACVRKIRLKVLIST